MSCFAQLKSCVLAENKMFLIEGANKYINLMQVIFYWPNIAFARKNWLSLTIFFVCQIFNIKRDNIRFIDLLLPIWTELKFKAFDQEYLTKWLMKNIISFFIVIFIDNFGLYKNIYRSMIGIYAIFAKFIIENF